MKRLLSLLLLFSLPATYGNGGEKPKPSVILSDTEVQNLRLELAEAAETDFEQTIFALGKIAPAPGKAVVVSSRIPGRALRVNVEPDQHVEKGETVVELESRQPGDPPPVIRIPAPIAGVVSELAVKPGQPVTQESELMEIIDLSQVHAIAEVPEHLAGKLARGQKAYIRVPAYSDRVFEATLAHIAAKAESQSGTLEAAFHVENPEELLRPGMRAEFSIVTASRPGVLAVPREAVQGDAGSRFVYVADYELKNAFHKVNVVTGAQNERFVEIVSGLLPGDQVVTQGAYALVFAGKGSVSLKEALDAAHGHAHAEDGSELPGREHHGHSRSGHHHEHEEGNRLVLFLVAGNLLLLGLLGLSLFHRKRTAS